MTAWTEPTWSYRGKFFHLENCATWPRPIQQPHPPIWVAARSAESVEWCAARRLPIAQVYQTTSQIEDTFDYYRKVARDGGWEADPGQFILLAADKSPYDGRCLEYRNPATGGPTFPTFSCWIQMLDPGERTSLHRHTANHLYHGFRGSGVVEVEDTELAWEEGDFMVVPNWSWHRHRNVSDTEPAILFSATDRPLLERLGLYREEHGNG